VILKNMLAALALGFCLTGAVSASTVTADGTGTIYEGDCTFACVDRYQQIYSSSLFSGPGIITAVNFVTSIYGGTWGNGTFQMSLSTSSNSVNGLSSTFSNNIGSDVAVFDTQTFSGSVVGGELFGFSGSFFYDPNGGDLLVDIILTAGSSNGPTVQYTSGSNTGGEYSRLYSFAGDPTGSLGNDYGNVTQFSISPVPLPAAGLLLLGALGGLGIAGRRRRTAA
jgi:hypothetical protein